MSDTNNDDPIELLRERAEQAAQFQARVEELERINRIKDAEVSIVRAGIPTGTKVGQAFLAELASREDVDLTNSEAIANAAREWGLFTAEGSDAKEPPAGQAGVATARVNLQTGSAPDAAPPPPGDMISEGWDRFKDRVSKGARREDAAAEVIDRIVTGAVHGDERARVTTGSSMGAPIQRSYEDRDIPYVSGRP